MDVIADHDKYWTIVKSNFDESWLKQEHQKITTYYNTKHNTRVLGAIENYVNPLVLLLHGAERNILERRRNSKLIITNETIDIVRLGRYIEILRLNNTTNLNDKLCEITSSDKTNFEKIINELQMASGFAKSNHKVQFIKTKSDSGQRTPDLLIDDNIEVECKKKDKATRRDIRNYELLNRLEHKLIELMNKYMKFYLVFAYFNEDPDNEMMKEIVRELQKIIQTGNDLEINLKTVNVVANKICENNEHIPLGIKPEILQMSGIDPNLVDEAIRKRISKPELVNYEANRPDFDATPFALKVQPDGLVITSHVMKFLFKIKDTSDRIKSIINSINDAKGQLTGDKIGIICVNLTHISEKLIESDFALLGQMIENVFRNNSRISAVAITSEFYLKEKEGVRFVHKASVIRNKNATKPLPQEFEILN